MRCKPIIKAQVNREKRRGLEEVEEYLLQTKVVRRAYPQLPDLKREVRNS
jgi:hypothetical protein